MRKLALNDEILLNIEKPARYIGNEINSVMKDKEKVAIRFAMCFPDVYEIGMSHLGIQILYVQSERGYLVRTGLFSVDRSGPDHAGATYSIVRSGIPGSDPGF